MLTIFTPLPVVGATTQVISLPPVRTVTMVNEIRSYHPQTWNDYIKPQLARRQQQITDKIAYDAQQTAIKAEQDRLAALAIQQAQTIYTAPTQPVVAYNGTLADWLFRLRRCESGGNYSTDTGNGFYGAYQFTIDTWNSWHTGYARADLAPPNVQDATIIKNTNASGLASQNPGCYAKEHLSNYPPN